ncbi:MAG: hypothetical protein PPP58_11745 [Natronomonas sp.]
MRRRTVLRLGGSVFAATAIAGCGSELGDETTPEPEEPPDGIDDEGEIDLQTLLNTTEETLNAESYHFDFDRSQSSTEDETVLDSELISLRFDREQEAATFINELGGSEVDDGRLDAYYTPEEGLSRFDESGEIRYEPTPQTYEELDPLAVDTVLIEFQQFAGIIDFAPVEWDGEAGEYVTTVDGFLEEAGETAIENIDGELRISADGVLLGFVLSGENEQQPETLDVELSISEIGSAAVEEPEWLPEAREALDGAGDSGDDS